MIRLSRQERETIINFNEAEDVAYIYTCSKPWMRHMEKVLGLKPAKIHSYAREYECPKVWIKKPRMPRRLSIEQKRRLSQRLHQKSILSADMPCAVGESGGKNVR
jgi:hypothetical protein